jgi:hypothetical protein
MKRFPLLCLFLLALTAAICAPAQTTSTSQTSADSAAKGTKHAHRRSLHEDYVLPFPGMLANGRWGCVKGELGYLTPDPTDLEQPIFIGSPDQSFEFPQKTSSKILQWFCRVEKPTTASQTSENTTYPLNSSLAKGGL